MQLSSLKFPNLQLFLHTKNLSYFWNSLFCEFWIITFAASDKKGKMEETDPEKLFEIMDQMGEGYF